MPAEQLLVELDSLVKSRYVLTASFMSVDKSGRVGETTGHIMHGVDMVTQVGK
jgi:hypothetical protein